MLNRHTFYENALWRCTYDIDYENNVRIQKKLPIGFILLMKKQQ